MHDNETAHPNGSPLAREGSPALQAHIAQAIDQAGGWLPFDRFMALALYAPRLGYYAHAGRKFGTMPQGGSDFVTAPELSPLFGQALAVQVADMLERTGTDEVWEFGAGTGALAAQLLEHLGERVRRYTIVDLSAELRARQQARLAAHAGQVHWADALPAQIAGVLVGNEVLDAMPVQLLHRVGGQWHERGVVLQHGALAWQDRPTTLRPPAEIPGTHDYLTEIHPQGQAFVRTLAGHVQRGAALLLDYGFPAAEYYHPQRSAGTLMCHQGHRADADPLADLGAKDITAHVDFTGIAVAAQDAGWDVLGYTGQARFLINCGLPALMETAPLAQRAMAHRLIAEHEMGELFKVLALSKGVEPWDAPGFVHGDRSHTL
ncbi:class I SAM-dependent methyltransferase [Pseudorhodoferax aquiterrae]|uniref:class I SAM-dependent methyltransferase n=1 Tax=Pseudorhodoferax aquiterrae TaxID=747304 RepID=UPI003570FF85